jgi:hypothetical protein
MILAFLGISQNWFLIGKVIDQVYGSRDHGWLSVHGGLVTMGRCGCSGAQKVIVTTWRERERRSSGFSPIAPLGGGAVKIVTQRCSTKATDGSPMGRWSRA